MTALSLQNQLPGAVCHEAAPGSPRGLRQSPALAAAKEKLQMSRVGHLLKAPVTAPAGPPGELGLGVSHLFAPEAPRESSCGEVSGCGKI